MQAFYVKYSILFSAFRLQVDACTESSKGNSQILHGSAGILQGFAHADLEQMDTPGHTRFLCNGSLSLNPILHTWFRDSCFTSDGSTTMWVLYLLLTI